VLAVALFKDRYGAERLCCGQGLALGVQPAPRHMRKVRIAQAAAISTEDSSRLVVEVGGNGQEGAGREKERKESVTAGPDLGSADVEISADSSILRRDSRPPPRRLALARKLPEEVTLGGDNQCPHRGREQ
jgi:hypothetical protein